MARTFGVNSSALIGSDIISEVDLGDLIWVTCGRRYPLGSHFDQSHIASSKNGLELFVVFLVLYVCILIFLRIKKNRILSIPISGAFFFF